MLACTTAFAFTAIITILIVLANARTFAFTASMLLPSVLTQPSPTTFAAISFHALMRAPETGIALAALIFSLVVRAYSLGCRPGARPGAPPRRPPQAAAARRAPTARTGLASKPRLLGATSDEATPNTRSTFTEAEKKRRRQGAPRATHSALRHRPRCRPRPPRPRRCLRRPRR